MSRDVSPGERFSPAVRAAVGARQRMRRTVQRRRRWLRRLASGGVLLGLAACLAIWGAGLASGPVVGAVFCLATMAVALLIGLTEGLRDRRMRVAFQESLQQLSPVEVRQLVTGIGSREGPEQREVLAVALQAMNRRESAVLPAGEATGGGPAEVAPAERVPPVLTGVEVTPPREDAA